MAVEIQMAPSRARQAARVEIEVEAGQVQVQAGTGQVGTTEWGSAERASRQVRAAREAGGEQPESGREWETPEGGVESGGGEHDKGQEPEWRAEDSMATETIFRSLSRKR